MTSRACVYKPQKIPAKKRRLCHVHGKPHVRHKKDRQGVKAAEKELARLSNKFKGSAFEVFFCEHCGGLHVGKVPVSDEEVF